MAVVVRLTVEEGLSNSAHHTLGSTEEIEEGFSEVADKPIDREVDGGVDHLEQLDGGHGVHIPDRGDSLCSKCFYVSRTPFFLPFACSGSELFC